MEPTSLFGYKLTNPIIVASSNFTDGRTKIEEMLSLGAQIVFTKTIYWGKHPVVSNQIRKVGSALFNSTGYSKKSIDFWCETLTYFVKKNENVVPNVFAETPEQLLELILVIERTGVKAVEISANCPNDDSSQNLLDYVKAVINHTKLHIIVKLTLESGYLEILEELMKLGISSVSLSDSLTGELKEDGLLRTMGYSGTPIKPLVLSAIRRIRAVGFTGTIIGIGGILLLEDVNDYLSAGADAVGLCSVLYLEGIKSINKFIEKEEKDDSV